MEGLSVSEKSSLEQEESLRPEAVSGEDESTPKSDKENDQYEEGFELPRGDVYALNSRRLNATQLQGIAESLELPQGGSISTIRQLIEGKLIEMEHEPKNVQVILQGKGKDDYKLFLVDDNGIISSFTHTRDHYEHVISQPVGMNVSIESSVAPRETDSKLECLQRELEMQSEELTSIREQLHMVQLALEEEKQKSLDHVERIKELQQSLAKERQKAKRFWREKCDQQLAHEDALEKKDDEINRLSRQLQCVKDEDKKFDTPLTNDRREEILDVPTVSRRGKAPPVHLFTGEGSDELWDEWLSTFKGSAEWNNWSDAECLLQLAGHLRGKARQEFLLLDPSDKSTYTHAVTALSSKFNFGSRSLAAQDF